MRRCIPYPVLTMFWLLSATFAVAQTPVQTLVLVADRITYATGYQTLTASGHVEATYGTIRVTASELLYDQKNDLIIVTGPLYLNDGDTVTIVADFARLSGDLKEAMLTSARMVLNQQLQISAVEINRTSGRYNQLFKAAASTCKISTLHPVPLWQIRARRIIHDQQTKQLYFEHAQFKIGNVTVAYFPRLRLPDPSVRRVSGFLVPALSQSNTFGTSLEIPYFLTLGDYADVTLSPKFTTGGSTTLGFAFRRRFVNGAVNLNGAVTTDSLTTLPVRGYLFGDGNLSFSGGTHVNFNLEAASDNGYLLQYGVSGKDTLESNLAAFRVRRNQFFETQLLGFHSQFNTVASDEIPFVLGDAYYRRRWSPDGLGGHIGMTLQTSALIRQSSTDIVGRDLTRVSAAVDWTRNWTLGSGLVFNATGEFQGDYYQVYQDTTYPAPIVRTVPIAAMMLRLPLSKSTPRATHILEPAVQIVWSPDKITAVPNDNSALVEFENTNLFSLNRFTGTDMYEQGLRANVGVSYSRLSKSGWTLGTSVGRVFRASDLGQFTTASGLSGLESSTIGTVSVELPMKLKFQSNTLFDATFGVSKNESRIRYKTSRLNLGSSYIWLKKDAAAGFPIDRSEWALDAKYSLNKNWSSAADWRYDRVAASPSSVGVALTYSNQCIKVDLSLSRRFTSSTSVSPSTSIGLKVSLEGFGSRSDSQSYTRQCGDY